MRSCHRIAATCIAGAFLVLLSEPALANPAQRAAHLLDYIAVDYPEAVRHGVVINELEYAEQLEFVAQVGTFLEQLEGDPSEGGLADLDGAIRARADTSRVEELARSLSGAIRSHYGVRVSVRVPPDLEAGAGLFALHCASCHGESGRGDGPAGVGLDPAPSDLGDPARMDALSPFTLYSTISFGIEGTGMVGYAPTLSEAERLDLTFFAAALSKPPESVAIGRRMFEEEPGRAAALAENLDRLLDLVPAALGPAERDLNAFLVSEPDALQSGTLPLELARTRLAESREAHRAGEPRRAVELAVSAYLDGFEPLEAGLSVVDPVLRDEAEAELMAFRNVLRESAHPETVDASYERILGIFDRTEAALGTRGLSTRATFLASFAVLTREGLEAILLVAAILGIVSRGQADEARRGRRAVHVGWVSALVCGAGTWWVASRLIAISGARREIVEGAAALLAAAVLIWVSYWMFSRLDTERWKAFLAARLEAAAARGALWVLGALAFLAVYREAFETVLFYQALAAQGGSDERGALVGGIAAALAVLAFAAGALLFMGKRLPLRPFFALSSVLLYAFAIVFVGQGIAALQEAGALSAHLVDGAPRIPWVGVFPTLQGIGAQAILLVLGLAAIPMSGALRPSDAPAS